MAYDRARAVAYARRWALERNPAYLNFDGLGGDCTNFVSQCLYAGCGVMNFTPVTGWYYRDAAHRAAAWTSVAYLYRFLTENRGAGPRGVHIKPTDVLPGDVVQLGWKRGAYTHSVLVVGFCGDEACVAAHTQDAWMRPLSTYRQPNRRFLRIET